MSAISSNLYSTAQLARAAGVSKRTLALELKQLSVLPRLPMIVHGNVTDAWAFSDLPEHHRKKIERKSQLHHARNVDGFIAASPEPWAPPMPLSEIADASITNAVKMRRALARALELRNDPGVGSGQLEAAIIEDHRRIFGFAITDRTARALLKRTVERDNFAENWNRLEIYLDGNPQRKVLSMAPQILADAEDFLELHSLMATFASAVNPSDSERDRLWIAAFTILKDHTDAGNEAKPMRVRIIDFLSRCAPWLAKNKNALRVAFNARCDGWMEDGCPPALAMDGRKARKGVPTAAAIPEEYLILVEAHAVLRCGGRLSQACREQAEVLEGTADPELNIMLDALEKDPAIAKFLNHKSSNKSYVNRRLREAVRYNIQEAEKYRLGGRTLSSARAAIERYYGGIPSGFCYSADDVTLPVWWYVPDGEGWFNLVRGQCLIMIDARTLCIIGYSLQPDRNYTSPVIHTLFTKVFAEWGVPKKLYLEMGIWKNAKLITGGPQAQNHHQDYEFMPFSWADTEVGLGRLGVEFHHAIRARSKVVERVIGLVQDLMEGEPGYGGREERHDLPETIKRQMEDVKCHRQHPSKYFYDFDQWQARLDQLFEKFNRTPQQGKLLAGMSPIEAQEKLQSKDMAKAPKFFDASARHLLAHYKVKKDAGRDGVTITVGAKSWTYRDGQLAQDKWKELLCWFNPDDPSVLIVTDMNMKKPYSVELSKPQDALDPDPESFADEMRRVEAYESHGKARYRVIKAAFERVFQPLNHNRAVVETGQQIRQQREVIDAGRHEKQTRQTTIRDRATKAGLPISIVNKGRDPTRTSDRATRNHFG
jgi:hypothetical protein